MSLLLEKTNRHPRDERIEFDEPTHVYIIAGSTSTPSIQRQLHSPRRKASLQKDSDWPKVRMR